MRLTSLTILLNTFMSIGCGLIDLAIASVVAGPLKIVYSNQMNQIFSWKICHAFRHVKWNGFHCDIIWRFNLFMLLALIVDMLIIHVKELGWSVTNKDLIDALLCDKKWKVTMCAHFGHSVCDPNGLGEKEGYHRSRSHDESYENHYMIKFFRH